MKQATKFTGQVLPQLQGRHCHFHSLLLVAGLGQATQQHKLPFPQHSSSSAKSSAFSGQDGQGYLVVNTQIEYCN